jgi:predicted house-cleaning noncanonical NTP pyrophosphatase (MazG superfamily)
MKFYNKLIRDKIPAIIEATGKNYVIRELNTDEYIKMLNIKLAEELDEYLNAPDDEKMAELADLVEVVYAIVQNNGMSIDAFEKIRIAKKEERGGFEKRLLLVSVDDE